MPVVIRRIELVGDYPIRVGNRICSHAAYGRTPHTGYRSSLEPSTWNFVHYTYTANNVAEFFSHSRLQIPMLFEWFMPRARRGTMPIEFVKIPTKVLR